MPLPRRSSSTPVSSVRSNLPETSQAVRALWRKAAGCGENPSAIVNLLEDRPLPARANARIESPSQLEALRRGREEAARAFADMGFGSEMPSSVAFDPYDQLMEEFILERHGEEGVRP